MKLQLGVLVLVGVFVALLLISSIMGFIRRQRRKHERPILATVTGIQLQATTWGSEWSITAVWRDGATGREYRFRGRSKYRPRQQVGDTVTVYCNLTNPQRFRMGL